MRLLPSLNTPQLLGYAGLLPFIGITLLLLSKPYHQAYWQHALLSYGAVILTFVGALHWAFAMQARDIPHTAQRNLYVWSVIPSLAAWLVLLLPYGYGCGLLVLFFVMALWRDWVLTHVLVLPDWYLPLRKTLTFIVTICLLVAIFN
jgi:hypothetical protein